MVCHTSAALLFLLPALLPDGGGVGGAGCAPGCLLHPQLVIPVVLPGTGHYRPGGLAQVNLLDHLMLLLALHFSLVQVAFNTYATKKKPLSLYQSFVGTAKRRYNLIQSFKHSLFCCIFKGPSGRNVFIIFPISYPPQFITFVLQNYSRTTFVRTHLPTRQSSPMLRTLGTVSSVPSGHLSITIIYQAQCRAASAKGCLSQF